MADPLRSDTIRNEFKSDTDPEKTSVTWTIITLLVAVGAIVWVLGIFFKGDGQGPCPPGYEVYYSSANGIPVFGGCDPIPYGK